MATFWFSLCDHCKHRRSEDTCAAFPDGMPSSISFFHFDSDHRRPFEGDNGIQFEPKDEEARQVAARLPRPVDPEKVRALTRRIAEVRQTILAILEETRQKLPSRLNYHLQWAEKLEDLPEDVQALVLEAEKRAGQTSTAL